MAASVLAAAALVTVDAPSASASGGVHPNSITACTFNGVQHLEIFLTAEGGGPATIDYVIVGSPDASGRFFYWFSETYAEDSNYNDSSKVDWFFALTGPMSVYGYSASDAGDIWLYEYSAVPGDLVVDDSDPNGSSATASEPVGPPLCSITYVLANLDGSDPRPAPPVPPAPPVSAPTTAVSCSPMPAAAGATVTCTVTGGDPGIDILWRASYNPVIAEAGVTLGADGSGTFSFVVPAAALGEEVMVELVDWMAPMSLGVTEGVTLVPTSVPAGEGRGAPAGPLAVTVALALVAGMVVRRRASDLVG